MLPLELKILRKMRFKNSCTGYEKRQYIYVTGKCKLIDVL